MVKHYSKCIYLLWNNVANSQIREIVFVVDANLKSQKCDDILSKVSWEWMIDPLCKCFQSLRNSKNEKEDIKMKKKESQIFLVMIHCTLIQFRSTNFRLEFRRVQSSKIYKRWNHFWVFVVWCTIKNLNLVWTWKSDDKKITEIVWYLHWNDCSHYITIITFKQQPMPSILISTDD